MLSPFECREHNKSYFFIESGNENTKALDLVFSHFYVNLMLFVWFMYELIFSYM